MHTPFDIHDRLAVVTGAGSGIGRATAVLFSKLGCHVIATDIDEAALQETVALAGGNLVSVVHDVASEADWVRVYKAAERFERLDIVVNNAGIMKAKPFIDADISDLKSQYAINVESVYMGCKLAIAPMLASLNSTGVKPSIINVSSIYGSIAGDFSAAYCASKGAVTALTKAISNELALTGIRINAVHPGPILTNLGKHHEPPKDRDGNLLSADQVMDYWRTKIPVGRLGEPDEIASAIAFLASDASSFMTGSDVIVDGGYTAI